MLLLYIEYKNNSAAENFLDEPDGVVSDRLYRQHAFNVGNINIKDLDKLGLEILNIL